MHPSMSRLYEASEKLRGVVRPSAVAALLGESPQTLNNWERGKGVSQRGAINAQTILGCNANWLLTGQGEMGGSVDTNTPNKPASTVQIAPAAVTLDLDADCLVVWKQLQQLPEDDREKWRADLDIASANARLAKLKDKQKEKTVDLPTPKGQQTKSA